MTTAIGAFSEEQVAKITGVSLAQLRAWAKNGFYSPALTGDGGAFARIYSFRDLVSLKVINNLRNINNVKMNELRRAATVLREYGEDAWAKTKLWVFRGKVLFEEPESGQLREVAGSQFVAAACVEVEISNVLEDVRRMNARTSDVEGRVQRNRYIQHRAYVVAGTRIPVSAIKGFHEAGYSVAEIMAEYPSLTRLDIDAAIQFDEARAA